MAGHQPAANPPAAGAPAVVAAATSEYLRGRALDMSALATSLGIGRATLYRWVGNRENLLATVLADAAERTFRTALRDRPGGGPAHVVDVMGGFVAGVVAARPLEILVRREPLLFVRLAVGPGAVEDRVTDLVHELLEQQLSAGTLALALPARSLAGAIVRVGAAHVHVALLGQAGAELASVLDVVALLLDAAVRPDLSRTARPPLLPAPRLPRNAWDVAHSEQSG